MNSIILSHHNGINKASQLWELECSLTFFSKGTYIELVNCSLCIVQLLSAYLQIILL